jgi:NADP-dependent 3-hydroxy acid dehydrogenase YdfG
MKNKIIVMTGGTSGFGAVTVKKFLQTPDLRVILGVRNNKSIPGVETLDLELKKSDNIHFFAKEIIKRLDNVKIMVNVLPAISSGRDVLQANTPSACQVVVIVFCSKFTKGPALVE